jgi:hypothetical protein
MMNTPRLLKKEGEVGSFATWPTKGGFSAMHGHLISKNGTVYWSKGKSRTKRDQKTKKREETRRIRGAHQGRIDERVLEAPIGGSACRLP